MDEQFLPMAKDLLDGFGTADSSLVGVEDERQARARVRSAHESMGLANMPTAALRMLEAAADRVLASPETVAYENEKRKAEDAERRGLHKVPPRMKTMLERAGGKDEEHEKVVRDEHGRLVAVEFYRGARLTARKVVVRGPDGRIAGTRKERVR
jgi:hypothetical protein